MNWVVVFKGEMKSMKDLIILKHKLRTDSAATKFMQGSTSNQKLAVKSLTKNSKAWLHEKYSKQIMFKQRWISTEQTTTPMKLKISYNMLHMLTNIL